MTAAVFDGEWFRTSGVRILVVAAIAVVVSVVVRAWVRRLLERATAAHGEQEVGQRRRRLATIAPLAVGTLTLFLWIVAGLIVLGELGVNPGPLIAGAGIIGVALGFGAQTIVRDTLSGFFILLENQYDVGDAVELLTTAGPIAGSVETLTLRVTAIRAFDGNLSNVPNGNIQVASNHTRGWGRAIVDVRVALDEDTDRVRSVLEELIDELQGTDPLEGWLRQPPKVIGVTEITAVAQVIRLVAETTPNHRIDTERLLLERVSSRISERGIKSPPIPAVPAPPS